MSMNSRERVLAALNHRQSDRMPVDFGGHRSSGIMAIAYARLKRALDITSGDIYVYDMIQQLAIVEPPVLEALGVDVIELGRGFLQRESDWKPWTLPDGTPCKIPSYLDVERRGNEWRLLAYDGTVLGAQREGCLYFEQTYFPLMERDIRDADFGGLEEQLRHVIWSAIAAPAAHLALDEAGLAQLAQGAKALRASTDRAIVGLFGGSLFELSEFLYRMDIHLTNMGLYPEAVHRLSEELCRIHLRNLERWLGAVGPYIDVVLFSDDLGGQSGPLLSPRMYREYYKPYHARMWRRAKELANVKVMLHCCGGVEPLLEDLIDAGLDAINPVQINSRGMETTALKARYGDRLVLWGGGCDTREVLPYASPVAVSDHVHHQVRALHPGGGFVFQQVHNIMADVPPENIIAMFEAVHSA